MHYPPSAALGPYRGHRGQLDFATGLDKRDRATKVTAKQTVTAA